MRKFTTIYSSPSIEALRELIREFLYTFNIHGMTVDDMFYYDVFCNVNTYANFDGWGSIPSYIEVPEILSCECCSYEERKAYVEGLIDSILKGEIEKPEWMLFIESEVCENGFAPSTFLYIKERDKEYKKLGELLLKFLYSPNMMSTLVDC